MATVTEAAQRLLRRYIELRDAMGQAPPYREVGIEQVDPADAAALALREALAAVST